MYDNGHDFTGIDGRCMWCDARPGGRAGSQPCDMPGGNYRPAEDER